MQTKVEFDNFEQLLVHAEEFECALAACFPDTRAFLAQVNTKNDLCATACVLSVEHASMLRIAFRESAPSSGSALLRLQYEALLRAAWILYAANANQLEKLSSNLSLDSEQAAKNAPGYLDMLVAVRKHAPAGLAEPLHEFSQYSRHALNSFVHGGIHPLRRTQEGFPVQLAARVVKMSNGLLYIAYRMLAVLTGSQRRLDQVNHVCIEFKECLPMPEPKPETL